MFASFPADPDNLQYNEEHETIILDLSFLRHCPGRNKKCLDTKYNLILGQACQLAHVYLLIIKIIL